MEKMMLIWHSSIVNKSNLMRMDFEARIIQ